MDVFQLLSGVCVVFPVDPNLEAEVSARKNDPSRCASRQLLLKMDETD